jgi:alpha-L-arabinofuranosidase
VTVRGAAIREARATVLSATDLRAHNSFEHPDALTPRTAPVGVRAGALEHTFAAASVTRLDLTL